MTDSLTYRCDMRATLRHTNTRDHFPCHTRAEFIVSPGNGTATRENSKLTCVQHTAKAVKSVMASSGFHQVKVTALREVPALEKPAAGTGGA